MEYCYLSASYDLATDLVTIVKVRNSKKGKNKEELRQLDDEARDHVKNAIKGLGLIGRQRYGMSNVPYPPNPRLVLL